jgi:hypothetical protein
MGDTHQPNQITAFSSSEVLAIPLTLYILWIMILFFIHLPSLLKLHVHFYGFFRKNNLPFTIVAIQEL